MSLTDASGAIFPAELTHAIESTIVGGAPLFSTLTKADTSSGSVAWPTAAPTGAGWRGPLGAVPTLTLNDSAYTVGVCKLIGSVVLPTESLEDVAFDVNTALSEVLVATFSADLDAAAISGGGDDAVGGPQPVGLESVATAISGTHTSLRDAVIAGWGEIGDAGGDAASVVAFAKPSTIAAEWASLASSSGVPMHGDVAKAGALMIGPGVPLVPAPKMTAKHVLVVDVSGTYAVRRTDFRVTGYPSPDDDGVKLVVRGRYAVACPAPAKRLRKFTLA